MAYRILSGKELYKASKIEPHLMVELLKGKTVIEFDTETESTSFLMGFVEGYLNSTYEEKEVMKFPMKKIGPYRDLKEAYGEIHGESKHNPDRKTWLSFPNKRYHEVQKYIDTFDQWVVR